MKKKQIFSSRESDKYARLLPAVNRIAGQLAGVGQMMQSERDCSDILNQIRAARAALRTLEGKILRTHLEDCLSGAANAESAEAQNLRIEEFLELYGRYDEAERKAEREE